MLYDLYVFDADSGVVIHWQKLEAENDRAAIALAAGISAPGPRELWRDQLLVTRLETGAESN